MTKEAIVTIQGINQETTEQKKPSIKEKNSFIAGLLDIECGLVCKEQIRGLENLDDIRILLEEKKPVFFMANHLSNADAPVLQYALSRHGFSDIRHKLVFLRGIRLDKKIITKTLSNSCTHIDVWPPTVSPSTPEERKQAMAMSRNSLNAISYALENGKIIMVFPEGTRSRDCQLGKGVEQVAHYLSDETYILPIAISGTEKILPTEKGLRSVIPVRAGAEIVFGKPFSISELRESVKGRNNASRKSSRQELMDNIMGQKIAPLLPNQYRGVYK